MKCGYAGKRQGRRTRGGGRVRLEENTKWIRSGRGLGVVVLTLHSFVYPPEPSIRPVVTQSSSSLLKLKLTPEILMHLSTAHTVHKDTYVVC